MGVIQTIVKLSTLSSNANLRLCFSKEAPKTSRKLVKLLDCLSLFESGSRPKGGIIYLEDEEEVAISLGGEQIGKDGRIDLSNMPLIPLEFYNSVEKGIVKRNDILVCKDGALTGKCCFVDYNFPIDEIMVNEHVYIFRSNETYMQKLLFFLIRDEYIQFQIKDLAYRKKGQPGLNTEHLKLIKIPFFELDEQNQIVEKIKPIEQEMHKLKSQKKEYLEIINKVFADEFNIDLEKVFELNSIKSFNLKLQNIDFRNDLLRTSYKWHKLEAIQSFMYEEIDCIEKLGKFIIQTKNGWSPESSEIEDGIPVLGQEHILKKGIIDLNPSKYTTLTKSNIQDFFIKQNDFFVSRGNTVELVALAGVVSEEIEQDIIYPDLYIKIDFQDEFVDKQYMSFLFNSFIGRIYFKHVAKGKNQTMVKVSSKELLEFYLPLPELSKQQQIVEKIKAQIDAQKLIDKQIEKKQKKISKIIEDCVK